MDLRLPVRSSCQLTLWIAGEPTVRQFEAWNVTPALQTNEIDFYIGASGKERSKVKTLRKSPVLSKLQELRRTHPDRVPPPSRDP